MRRNVITFLQKEKRKIKEIPSMKWWMAAINSSSGRSIYSTSHIRCEQTNCAEKIHSNNDDDDYYLLLNSFSF